MSNETLIGWRNRRRDRGPGLVSSGNQPRNAPALAGLVSSCAALSAFTADHSYIGWDYGVHVGGFLAVFWVLASIWGLIVYNRRVRREEHPTGFLQR